MIKTFVHIDGKEYRMLEGVDKPEINGSTLAQFFKAEAASANYEDDNASRKTNKV